MKTVRVIAVVSGALATVVSIASYLPSPFMWPVGPSAIVDSLVALGLVLLVVVAVRRAWSRLSTAALILCLVPFGLMIVDLTAWRLIR